MTAVLITPPPSPPPSRNDPANFAERGDAHVAWQETAVAQMNAQCVQNNTLHEEVIAARNELIAAGLATAASNAATAVAARDEAVAARDTAVTTTIPALVAEVEVQKNTAVNTTIPGHVTAVDNSRIAAQAAMQDDVDAVDAMKATALTVDIPNAIASVAAINNRGDWAAVARTYALKDIVKNGSTWYMCVEGHSTTTESVFATDALTKWRVYQGITSVELAGAGGSALVGHYSETVGGAISRIGKRSSAQWISENARNFPIPAFASPATTDVPTVSFSQFTPGSSVSMLAPSYSATSSIRSGSTVTVTLPADHGFYAGDVVNISGITSPSQQNGNKLVTGTPTARTFTYVEGTYTNPAIGETSAGIVVKRAEYYRAPHGVFTYGLRRENMISGAASPVFGSWQSGYNSVVPHYDASLSSPGYKFSVEFVSTEKSFEALFSRAGSGIRLYVDDVIASKTLSSPYDDASIAIAMSVVFSSAKERKIRLEFTYPTRFMGVFAGSVLGIKKSPGGRKPLALFLSDSFGEGTGAKNGRYGSYAAYICQAMGWEHLDGALGSTGITTDGVQGTGRRYIGRLRRVYSKYKPDIVFVQASVNDGGSITEANAGALFDEISRLCPNALIIAAGPLYPTTSVPGSTYTSETNLKTACSSRGIPFLDGGIGSDGPSWLTPGSVSTFYSGTAATATSTISGGAVDAVSVIGAGDGYDIFGGAPAVTFGAGAGGTGAAATAVMNYKVTALQLLNGGGGYTSAPTVTIGGGATAVAHRYGGANYITGITVYTEGDGYIEPPIVEITGGGYTTQAAAVAEIENGKVVRIRMTNVGFGYKSNPTVTIKSATTDATATATIDANGRVDSLTLTGNGSYYTSPPNVYFSNPNSGGGGAEAVAFLSGTVASVSVTSGGSGYTSAPTVTIAHPHPLGASDNTHPKETGHQMIAANYVNRLKKLG